MKTIKKHNNKEKTFSLPDAVHKAMACYFKELDGEQPSNVYDLIIAQVEKPLFESVLKQTNMNQSKAAEILGVNRGTLRKKLKQYDLL